MRIHKSHYLVLAFLITVASSGCDDPTPPPPPPSNGSFEITYSGDVSGTISGLAFFLEQEAEGPEGSVVGFSVFGIEVDDQEDGFSLLKEGPQPGPGTYSIFDSRTAEPAEGEIGLIIYEDTKNLSVDAIDGTVTFNQSNSDRVTGSLEATLVGFMSGTEVTISATGSFEAVSCVDNVENCPSSISVP